MSRLHLALQPGFLDRFLATVPAVKERPRPARSACAGRTPIVGATIAETSIYHRNPLSFPFRMDHMGYEKRLINLR